MTGLRRDRRGRVTIPDVVFALMSLAVLGALWPVFRSSLADNAGEVGTGTGYLFGLWLPLAILVFLTMIWRAAVGGSSVR